MTTRDDLAWQEDAKCATDEFDVGDFFPPKHRHVRKTARELCEGCPVQAECLSFALTRGERFGIWGGLTERERRAVRRSRTGGALEETG